MGSGLLIFGVVVRQLIALLAEPSKLAQLLEWLNQHPVLGWGGALFALVAMAVAVIAKFTGNLDKIFSFRAKYLSRAKNELSNQQLEDFRRLLLQQMKTDVAQRLEDALHNLIRVDLEQEEQRYQIGRRKAPLVKAQKKERPFTNLIQRGLAVFRNSPAIQSIEPAERTYTIFHRPDIGRRLLILGEPGAGKTTELLTVTQRLVDKAIADSAQPVPLIFELSSWTPGRPILSWVAQQLNQFYGVSQKLAEPLTQQWIQQNHLLVLLDGLDELGEQNQVACIEALEIFLAQHPALAAIVCCRREEYEQGRQQLKQLNGAIYLQAIRPPQIRQYLYDLKREQLWNDIQTKPKLLHLAQSPLFLTMLVVAYYEQPIFDAASLFDAYIQKQLHDPSYQGIYKPGKEKTPQKTLHYLGWLATQLKEKQETEFLIENLQPNWLQSSQLKIYRLFIGLVFGPIVGITSALGMWLVFALTGPINTYNLSRLNIRLNFDPQAGLIIGLTIGLLGGLLIGLSGELDEIEPMEKLSWTLDDGTSIRLWRVVILGPFNNMSVPTLTNEIIEQKQISNQGIKRSLQNGLTVGLIFGLWGAVISGFLFWMFGWMEASLPGKPLINLSVDIFTSVEWRNVLWDMLQSSFWDGITGGLIGGIIGGLIGGITGGFLSVIQHFILRICLTQNGNAPWNYAQFLEYAARHRFIQRTGGRYRFIHDLLREHFARMTPQQHAKLARPHRHKG